MNDAAPPEFTLIDGGDTPVLRVTGDWTIATISQVDDALRELQGPALDVDISNLGRIDTAGAFVLDRTRAGGAAIGDHAYAAGLLAQVRAAADPCDDPAEPGHSLVDLLERLGKGSVGFGNELVATLAFLGETLVTCGRLLLNPFQMRWNSVVSAMEEAGLDAVPIVMFLSFFVGMVVAYIGATTLQTFDLEIYTVELIGYSMLREFGVVLTGIVLAGRTNSSFTAQIGTMKMRQEVDAMETLGLKAMDVLVAPRVIAMVIMTPVLAFAATLAGIAGGMMVGWLSLDINPGMFIDRLRNSVPIDQFWIGLSKAPVFGLVTALIACRHGLQVQGSVQSLGKATTTSVVQAIFAIIVIDAIFAIFYMELGI